MIQVLETFLAYFLHPALHALCDAKLGPQACVRRIESTESDQKLFTKGLSHTCFFGRYSTLARDWCSSDPQAKWANASNRLNPTLWLDLGFYSRVEINCLLQDPGQCRKDSSGILDRALMAVRAKLENLETGQHGELMQLIWWIKLASMEYSLGSDRV